MIRSIFSNSLSNFSYHPPNQMSISPLSISNLGSNTANEYVSNSTLWEFCHQTHSPSTGKYWQANEIHPFPLHFYFPIYDIQISSQSVLPPHTLLWMTHLTKPYFRKNATKEKISTSQNWNVVSFINHLIGWSNRKSSVLNVPVFPAAGSSLQFFRDGRSFQWRPICLQSLPLLNTLLSMNVLIPHSFFPELIFPHLQV